MKGKVAVAQATRDEVVLPERVQEALGHLVGAAKEGLLALSVGVGLGVLSELMEEEVDDVVGAKGRWNADRAAVRHGHEPGEVTLGGRRVAVERPRVRTADGESEVELATYQHFGRLCCFRGWGEGLREGARRAASRVPAVRRSESRGADATCAQQGYGRGCWA